MLGFRYASWHPNSGGILTWAWQDFRSSTSLDAEMRHIFHHGSLSTGLPAHLKGMASLKALCNAAEPTITHHLMEAMSSRGNLLRWYTQNIDSLEFRLLPSLAPGSTASGSMGDRCVALHGRLDLVWCNKCRKTWPWNTEHTEAFELGFNVPCSYQNSGL